MRKQASFFIFLKQDIRNGLGRQWPFFLTAALMVWLRIWGYASPDGNAISFYDVTAYLFKGMEIFEKKSGNSFIVPIDWFALVMLPAFLVGNHATADLNGFGMHMLLKSRSRMAWWCAKLVWCLFTVVFYFLLLYGILSLYVLYKGGTFLPTLEVWLSGFSDVETVSAAETVIIVILIPVCAVFAVSVLQMVLSLVGTSQAAFGVVVAYQIISAYFTAPVFLGNYTMMLKNSLLIGTDGVSWEQGLLWSLCYLAVGIIFGTVYIRRMELYRFSGNQR